MKIGWFNYYKRLKIKIMSDSNSDNIGNEVTFRAILLHLVIGILTIAFLIFGSLSLINGDTTPGIIGLISATLLFIGLTQLYKSNKLEIASISLIVILSLILIYSMFSSDAEGASHLGLLVIPFIAPFLLGGKKGFLVSSAIGFILIIYFVSDYSYENYNFFFKLRFIGVFAAVSIISSLIEEVGNRYQRILDIKKKELEKSLKVLRDRDDKLNQSSSKYQILFEESNDSIIIVEKGKIIDCNKRTMDLFGYNKEELMGMPLELLSPKFQSEGILSKDKMKTIMETVFYNKTTRYEWAHLKKDGKKIITDSNLHLLSNHLNEMYFFSIRDITIQKEVRSELLKAKEQAEKSDKLKSEFLAQMSHEIRTPINAIMNFSSLLKMDLADQLTEDNLISFNAIENSAARLVRTINLILNMSEIETGTLEPDFVEEKIAERIIKPIMIEFKHAAAEKNLNLIFNNELPPEYKVKIDTYTISHSIINLVDNAIKYTREGEVVLHLYKSGTYIILDIIDTGIGISEEYLPHLFQKFSQEEQGYTRQFEGNGLGLALVKEYCRLNDADIQVESVKGSGSKFTIILNDT